MPRGDRTGPNGEGPRTGRGSGLCAGNERPGFETSPGGGFGRMGRGKNNRLRNNSGRGLRNRPGYNNQEVNNTKSGSSEE